MRAVRSSRHDQRRLRKTRVELDDNSQMHGPVRCHESQLIVVRVGHEPSQRRARAAFAA